MILRIGKDQVCELFCSWLRVLVLFCFSLEDMLLCMMALLECCGRHTPDFMLRVDVESKMAFVCLTRQTPDNARILPWTCTTSPDRTTETFPHYVCANQRTLSHLGNPAMVTEEAFLEYLKLDVLRNPHNSLLGCPGTTNSNTTAKYDTNTHLCHHHHLVAQALSAIQSSDSSLPRTGQPR